jgi:hypothetical protein
MELLNSFLVLEGTIRVTDCKFVKAFTGVSWD